MTKDKKNNKITEIIAKICDEYKVNPIEGVLSHRMKRDIIDGLETILCLLFLKNNKRSQY